MSGKGNTSQFENAFSRAGVIKPPSPEVIAEAKHIEFSSNEIIKLLQDIIEAVPQVNLASVADLIEQVQETSTSITLALSDLATDVMRLASEHDKKIKEADELLQELKRLKDDIIAQLTKEANLNPDTGPGDELAVLPTGEVMSPSEPLLITYETPTVAKVDDVTKQDVLSTNLDPVIESDDVDSDIFSRPIGSVPINERVRMSDLETQQPRTPEEVEELKLLRMYQDGEREVFKNKPLKEIVKEVSRLYDLVGRENWRNKKIRAIATEIHDLNVNLVLERKEKRKRLDDAYERLFLEAQKNLLGREHRFRLSASTTENFSLTHDPIITSPIDDAPAVITPAQSIDNNSEPDPKTVPAKTPTISVTPTTPLDLSKVPTLTEVGNYEEALADIDYKLVVAQAQLMEVFKVLSKIGFNYKSQSEEAVKIISDYKNYSETNPIQTLSDKDNYLEKFNGLLERTRVVKIKGANVGEFEQGRILRMEGDQVLVEKVNSAEINPVAELVSLAELKELNSPAVPVLTDAINIPSAVDINAVTTPEASQVEAPLTAEEAYAKEKEKFYSLRDLVYERQLGLKYYYELDRAEIHIQTIDYVISKYQDNDLIREQKVRDNVEALVKINARMAEGLSELGIDSSLSTPGPEASISTVPEPVEPSYLELVADDPLMKATLEAEQKAKWREGVGLSPERQVDTVPFKERKEMRNDYAKERTLAIESRNKFKTAESDYQAKLKEFYENRSLFSEAGGAIRTLFGGQPKLPPEVAKLQTIYKYTKEQYALKLRDAWEKRGGAFAGNKVLDEAKPSIKKAFAKKFVLEPRYRLLTVQAEALEKVAENSKLKPIMKLMREHKTRLRWLGLSLAAVTGASAGGALLAGFNMARWGVATLGGVAVANTIYRQKEQGINDAVSKLSLEKEKIENEFTLAKLNEFDESLAFGSLEVEKAKLKQKVYTIGSAVVVGGAVNLGASFVDNIPSTEVSTTPRTSGTVLNEGPNKLSAQEAERLAGEQRILEIQKSVREINEAVAADNARVAGLKQGVSYQPLTKPTPQEVPLNLEATPQTLLQMAGVKVPHYSPSGEVLSQTIVSNIRLQGATTGALVETTLPDSKVIEIYSHLNYKINDLLSARPNFSQAELEKALFNELQNIYGGEGWWTSANINEVKIDSMEVTKPGLVTPASSAGTLRAEVAPIESLAPGEESTPTLTLVADNLTLENETPATTSQSEPIFGKEPINYARSGGLAIDADSEVRTVPILKKTFVAYNPAEAVGTQAVTEIIPTREINHLPFDQTESLPIPRDPNLYATAGNYTNSAEFKDYLNSEYGSVAKFNKILLNQALAVENDTYDIFNKWLNEYKSPYQMSLSKMTMGDLKEAFGGPDVGSRVVEVDTTGLPKQYDTEAIRQYASANNFNYETVREWLVRLEDLKKEFPHQDTTTLEDLFARSIIKADLLALQAGRITA